MATVLVVDDNPDACRMLARLVGKCGHEGVYATSGEEALSYLRTHAVALLVLDNMMPRMDGLEVLGRVRSRPEWAALPVVMWSAVADPAFIGHALRKGADDYWVKASFDYAHLPERLGQVLNARGSKIEEDTATSLTMPRPLPV